jgi:hypothetical protein
VALQREDEARRVGEHQDARDVEAERLDVLGVLVLRDARVDRRDHQRDDGEEHHAAVALGGGAAEVKLFVPPSAE